MTSKPLKWHGGKHYLAGKIVPLLGKHTHYVEPFAGGLSVLLAKPYEGVSEVINDLHSSLMNFYRVLQNQALFPLFVRKVSVTPFSEELWKEGKYSLVCDFARGPCLDCAWRFFVLARQSMSGRMTCFSPLSKSRVRRGMNDQVSSWLSVVEGLPMVHERLKRVAIRHACALDVIRQEDSEHTLFYLDPPYLHQTRSTTKEYGPYEMTDSQHEELLKLIVTLKGKVALSGYESELYARYLHQWREHTFFVPNSSSKAGTKEIKEEHLWMNY